jgi:hypothetical protein
VGRTPGLDTAIIAEETSADPTIAADQYRSAIARFDAQRADAAQAVFRLGECLRKLGRMEEAKVQYARILREFVDEAELVKLSQKRLNESLPNASNQFAAPPRKNYEELNTQEMDLVREQIAGIEQRVANGVESSASLLPLRRELLRLEQERAIRAQTGASNYFPAVSDSQSRLLSPHEEDLRAVESELRKQGLEFQKLVAVKNMIEKGDYETLTPSIIDDPRFLKLKAEYEEQFTKGPLRETAEVAQENLKQVRQRLYAWVDQIYLPELRSSITFAESRIEELNRTRAELDDRNRREQTERKKEMKGEEAGGKLRRSEPAGR